EPTSGTDTTSLKTTARRDGDHYLVNGQKIWTSRAEHSDLMLLLARTTPKEKAAKRTDGLSVFIVEMREALGKGLTIHPIRTMMNHSTICACRRKTCSAKKARASATSFPA